jgi:hypothetical protein
LVHAPAARRHLRFVDEKQSNPCGACVFVFLKAVIGGVIAMLQLQFEQAIIRDVLG